MSVTLEHRWNTGSHWADGGRCRGDSKSVWSAQSLPGVTGAEGKGTRVMREGLISKCHMAMAEGHVAHLSSVYNKVLESRDIMGEIIRKVECSSVC